MLKGIDRADALRIAAGTALLALAAVLPWGEVFPGTPGTAARIAMFAAAYLVLGGDVLWRAVRGIAGGQVFDENFLMGVATLGAFGLGEYSEAVAVMLFYQIGELFQRMAVGR